MRNRNRKPNAPRVVAKLNWFIVDLHVSGASATKSVRVLATSKGDAFSKARAELGIAPNIHVTSLGINVDRPKVNF